MKKSVVVLLLALVLMFSFVSAMKGPVTVYTEPGNRVKIYAWIPNEKGQALYELREGLADQAGIFSTTFFSLADETVKFQVRIMNGLIPIKDNVFENYGTLNALKVDCISENCLMSIDESWVAPVEEVPIVNSAPTEETQVSADESAGESTETEETTKTQEASDDESFLAGLAVFTKEDGSRNWFGMSIFGVVLVLVIVAVFMFLHRGRNGSMQMMSNDERELQSTERRVKQIEDEVNNLKERKQIKAKIAAAKQKLLEEEKELKRLMGSDRNDRNVERQKQVVEDARDELEEHRSNL